MQRSRATGTPTSSGPGGASSARAPRKRDSRAISKTGARRSNA
jgi:hypothetical protein